MQVLRRPLRFAQATGRIREILFDVDMPQPLKNRLSY